MKGKNLTYLNFLGRKFRISHIDSEDWSRTPLVCLCKQPIPDVSEEHGENLKYTLPCMMVNKS